MEEGEAPSAGGGEDFGELYRANLRPLLGMATALIGSRAQAEEVVQEAFATTFDHYGRLEDPTKALRRSVLRGGASHKADPDDPSRATERILEVADELGARSVAVPAISTGAYAYPRDKAARVAVRTLLSTPTEVEEVRLVAFDDETLALYQAELEAAGAA